MSAIGTFFMGAAPRNSTGVKTFGSALFAGKVYCAKINDT